ncbi:NUDIX domain-containing protein [Patescibacteria group bacterium]|nr:NUDIX domain-containing protein [Patescibacteria group bacterium]
MEYVDIYNSDGTYIGKKTTRDEAHKKGFWHKSAHVWFINSNKELLIQKRSLLMDSHPGQWDISVAGHVSADEEVISSALREVQEEIGLKLKANDLFKIGELKQSSRREGYINNEINVVYIVEMDLNINDLVMQAEEVSELKFIPYKELKNIIENNNPDFVAHSKEYKLLFNYMFKLWNIIDS